MTLPAVTESDLLLHYPMLDQLRPTPDYRFNGQIDLGRDLATKRFRESRELDPLLAKAHDPQDWATIETLYTLSIIFGANTDPDWVARAKEFARQADMELGSFTFSYDTDASGDINPGSREERQSLRTIVLRRG